MLANKCGTFNPRIGRMDIDGTEGYVTLPYDVEAPLGILINKVAAFGRDQWFRFHVNGPGDNSAIDGFSEFYDDAGYSCLAKDICTADYVEVVGTDPADADKVIKIFGTDEDGNELFEDGSRGITIAIGTTTATKIKQIYSVSKDATQGLVRLRLAGDSTLIALYYPQETSPNYRRIRVPKNSTVSMIYTRRVVEVSSEYDYVPIDHKLAMMLALKSVKAYRNDNIQAAVNFEQQAERLLREQQATKRIRSGASVQIKNFSSDYGKRLRGRGGCGC
jgi:hypothetical protein